MRFFSPSSCFENAFVDAATGTDPERRAPNEARESKRAAPVTAARSVAPRDAGRLGPFSEGVGCASKTAGSKPSRD